MAKDNGFIDDFFRDVHEAEFQRKDKHDAADSFLLAVLTVLGGIGYQYLKLIPWEDFDKWAYGFIALAFIYAILWAWAAICVACAVWPRDVGYLSNPKKLNDYLCGLIAHYGFNTADIDEVEQLATPEVKRLARKQYIEAAEVNRLSNQRKLKWQTRAKRSIIFAVFVILFNAPPMYVVQHSHRAPEKVQLVESPTKHKIEIVSPDDKGK